MIRVIRTDDQIIDGERGFALYNTVTDLFVIVSDTQVWSSADDLAQDFDDEISYRGRMGYEPGHLPEFKERCVGLARGNGY